MTIDQPINRLPDFNPGKKRRGAFTRVMASLLGWGIIFGLALLGASFWAYSTYTSAGPLKQAKVIELASDLNRGQIAVRLADEGVISDARVFSLAGLAQRLRGVTLKPGEYSFPANATMAEVFNIVSSGRVVMHKLTIPEGFTSAMAVARLRAQPALAGEITAIPPEGSVIANTFLFPRGKARSELLAQMMEAQAKLVDEIWAKRPATSILKTKEEMVALASIIEKETAKAEERPQVAAVFINRLKLGMRLQSDPTIIYGITKGAGRLNRPLTRTDIDTPTPYNTYTINGLPPGPIASPGKASLEAAINPAPTRDIYFVADGTGGHVFAETLDEHNANVARWRAIEAQGGSAPPQAAESAQDDGELAELEQIAKVVQPSLPDMPAIQPPAPVAPAEAAPATDPPATAQQLTAEAGSAAPTETAPAQEVVTLKPGTVMKFGSKLIPIPALKGQN